MFENIYNKFLYRDMNITVKQLNYISIVLKKFYYFTDKTASCK